MFQRGDTSYEYVIPDAFQSGPRIYSYVTFDYPFRFKIYWMGGTSAEDTYVIAESEDTVRPWTSHSAILTEPLYSIRYELIQPPANPIYGPGRGYFYVFNTNPSPTVPEPAAWAMMIAGFGLVGLASRRRRKIATAAG